jgi:putative ABC transport system permease protein
LSNDETDQVGVISQRLIDRAIEVNRTETETSKTRFVPTALAPSLREEIPEIETAAHAHRTWVRMNANDKTLGGIRIAAIEPEMLDILDIEFIVGSPALIFSDPGAIAVTERTARRFFGDADPIGQTVSVTSADYGGERVIRALVKDRINTTFRFDYLQTATVRRSWTGWRGNTYILLRADADRLAVEGEIEDLLDRKLKPETAKQRNYVLYPLSRVYLHLTHDYDTGFIYEAWGDISQIRLFSAVAIIVLIISCINFTNLAIARSGNRAREVGMRKVSGATKSQLAVQFLSESVLTAFVSLGFGLIALTYVLPEFNSFFRRQIDLDLLTDPTLALGSSSSRSSSVSQQVCTRPSSWPRFSPSKLLRGPLVERSEASGSVKAWSSFSLPHRSR